jgi:hypothetical protein
MARTRLRKFEEELHVAFDSGMNTYSGHTSWNFVNGVLYCMTIISTIGTLKELVNLILFKMFLLKMG